MHQALPSGRSVPPSDRIARAVALLVAATAFLLAWWRDPRRPTGLSPADGWWSGFDQSHYLASALAIAHLDFSPASHWYLAAYPALAAGFVWLVPADPFMLSDLACLLASVWLSAELGAVLSPGWRYARMAGLAGFLCCSVLPPVVLDAWVMPWTSTLAAPLVLAALLATVSGLDRPGTRWWPFAAGAAAAAISGCRPVDAVLVLGCCGIAGVLGALRTHGARRAALAWPAWFLFGAVCGAMPDLLLYLRIWGPHESPYLVSSALIGFDPWLLPLHWVELVVSPRPLLPGVQGLAQRLPFFGAGLLGLAGALLVRREDWLRHLLTAGVLVGSVALYLCYRDLHAPGLWQFHNYHYFKWCFGLLGYYALVLARLAAGPGRMRLLWLLPVAALLFCWRVSPTADAGGPRGLSSADGGFAIAIPRLGVADALVVPAAGAFDPIYFGTHRLAIDGQPVAPISGYKALPIEGGMVITPLRAWPAGLLSVRFVDGVRPDASPAPFLARIRIRPGLPCWFGWRQAGCDADRLLPPSLIAADVPTTLGIGGPPVFGPGWSYADADGRWTLGSEAELRFRTGAPADHTILLLLSASPIWRPGLGPATVRIRIGRRFTVDRALSGGEARDVAVCAPASARTPDGAVDVWLDIDQTHRPSVLFPPSRDDRPLGLFVRSVRWRDVPC